jgi:hypothetical protein
VSCSLLILLLAGDSLIARGGSPRLHSCARNSLFQLIALIAALGNGVAILGVLSKGSHLLAGSLGLALFNLRGVLRLSQDLSAHGIGMRGQQVGPPFKPADLRCFELIVACDRPARLMHNE